jgi:hypothetical protein
MKYKPTPLNISSVIVIGFTIYAAINPGSEGWGILGLIYIFPFALLGLFIDFLIQKFSKRYVWVLISEFILIGLLVFGYFLTERKKILILPNNFNNHIVIIYGIETAPRLPISFLTWNYIVKIPKNGILLTSTKVEDDFSETKMITSTGIELNSDKTNLGFVKFSNSEIKFKGKTYNFVSWKVDSISCCGYSSKDMDSLKVKLENDMNKIKTGR